MHENPRTYILMEAGGGHNAGETEDCPQDWLPTSMQGLERKVGKVVIKAIFGR